MLDLHSLWRSRLRVLLTNLAEHQQEYREIGSVAAQVTADYHGRFLIELLQNAADQAVGLPQAKILIVWTAGLLAVANQGAPFSREGLDAITSIALSPKRPDESIGNKGIGFKSVFEVTEAPEIYSGLADERSASGLSPLCWRLHRNPFDLPGTKAQALQMVHAILEADVKLKGALHHRFGQELETHVWRALRQSAPFKYPIGLGKQDLEQRIDELGLTDEERSQFQTLVVLPLLPQAGPIVGRSLKELLEPSEALMTFLPNITELYVRAAPVEARLEARLWREDRRIEANGSMSFCERFTGREIKTHVEALTRRGWLPRRLEDPVKDYTPGAYGRRWWVAERRIGELPSEAAALREVLGDLPGDHWKSIRYVPLSVALPQPDPETLELEPDGRFVVGLPTQVRTGTPLWVDSHFHATLSRTGLDLENRFNRMLLEKAVQLVGALLEQLKRLAPASGELPLARLAVALAFLRSEGHLAEILHRENGLCRGEVILAPDGRTFLRGADLRIPAAEDVDIFLLFDPNAADKKLEQVGYRFAHPALLRHHHPLLKTLEAKLAFTEERRPLCIARIDGEALVETWARGARHDGPQRWEPFLRWLVRRFREEDLRGLRILPTGVNDLSAPDEGVFLALVEQPSSQDEPAAGAVPPAIQGLLNLFDTRALPCRRPDGELTEVGRRLTGEPKAERLHSYLWQRGDDEKILKLLHRPTFKALLSQALPRALEQAVGRGDETAAWALLKTGLEWLARPGTRLDTPLDRMMLPVSAGTWRPAGELALGPGWLDSDEAGQATLDALLERLYGNTGRRCCDWITFQKKTGVRDEARPGLRAAFLALGVVDRPRMTKLPPVPIFTGDISGQSALRSPCPLPGLERPWDAYSQALMAVASRSSAGVRYSVAPIWIDGLEDPDTAASVLAWLLRHPEGYVAHSELTREPPSWGNTTVLAWWLHAARALDLPIIPTGPGVWSGRALRASEVCILSDEERGSRFLRLLPHLPPGVNETLPKALGVVALKDGDAAWLVTRLEAVAALWRLALFSDAHRVEGLVTELYLRLNARCERWDARPMLDVLLPAWRGESLDAMRLREEPVLYLEDDPYPTRYIPRYGVSPHLRIPRNADLSRLIAELQGVLGTGRVIRTSQAPLEVPFIPEVDPGEGLLSWLESRCGIPELRLHLAVAVVHGRGSVPEIRPFHREAWGRLDQARLLFGQFADDAQAFYDPHRRILFAAQGLMEQPLELLEACWQVVGSIWRQTWVTVSALLARGEGHLQRYFREERIGAREYEQVRVTFGLEPAVAEPAAAMPDSATSGRTSPAVVPFQESDAVKTHDGTRRAPPGAGSSDGPDSNAGLAIAGRSFALLEAAEALSAGGNGELGKLLQQHLAAKDALDTLLEPFVSSGSQQLSSKGHAPAFATGIGGEGTVAHREDRPLASRLAKALEPVPGFSSNPISTPPEIGPRLTDSDPFRGDEPVPQDRDEGAGGLMLGVLGEAFAFEQLRQWLPGFEASCWISPLRRDYGLDGPVEPDAGCDFRYLDTEGVLTGIPGTECWVEVKSNAERAESWVRLSRNEWEAARICHETPARCYVLLRVSELASTPRIASIIRDPFGLYRAGALRLNVKEVWLHTAAGPTSATQSQTVSTQAPSGEFRNEGLSEPVQPPDSLRVAIHTGGVIQYHWRARSGNGHTETCWSCCGQMEWVEQCTRVPGRHHPGKLVGGGSRRSGGAGRAWWNCCWRNRTEPGCQDEGGEVEATDQDLLGL